MVVVRRVLGLWSPGCRALRMRLSSPLLVADAGLRSRSHLGKPVVLDTPHYRLLSTSSHYSEDGRDSGSSGRAQRSRGWFTALGSGLLLSSAVLAAKSQTESREDDAEGYPSEPKDDHSLARFDMHEELAELHLPVKLARKIVNPADTSGLNLRLYQYQTCPFCCKVRAFLDYYGFSYEVVEVHPVSRRQIKFARHKKVPILLLQGYKNKALTDSSFIVSLLNSYMLEPTRDMGELLSFYPHLRVQDEKGNDTVHCENKYFIMFEEKIKSKEGIARKREEREWREWVDGVFIHIISPNVYRSPGEALETFKWFSEVGDWEENFPFLERLIAVYLGATAMFYIAKRLKKKHNLKPDVRESMYDACRVWMNGVGPYRKFMGGSDPSLADLAMYGALTSFEGTRTFKDILANTNLGPWFYAVKELVNSRHGEGILAANLRKAGK